MAKNEELTFLNVIRFLQENAFPDCEAETLGEYLNIQPGTIRTLKFDSNTSRRLLHKVIDHWFQNDSEKSWKKLADAVKLCNYSNIAEVANSKQGSATKLSQNRTTKEGIVSSLTPTHYSSDEEGSIQTTVRSKVPNKMLPPTPVILPRKQSSALKSSSQSGPSSGVKSKVPNKMLPRTPVILPREQNSAIIPRGYTPRNQGNISSELNKIEDRFTVLKESLLNELKTKPNEVSVDTLISKISCMKAEVMRYAYNSWRKTVKRIFHNLDELFTYLNADVWTIFDYYLLAYLIKSLGSEQLKTKLEVYVVKLDNFKKTTLVSDFIYCWKDILHETSNPEFEKIIIKYDETRTTLADLEDDIRNKIKAKYFPSLLECVSCIFLGRFQKATCVRAVTFQVPKEKRGKKYHSHNNDSQGDHIGTTPNGESEIPVLECASNEEKTSLTDTTGHNPLRFSSHTLPRMHSPIPSRSHETFTTPQNHSIKDDHLPSRLDHSDRSNEERQDKTEELQERQVYTEERVQHLEASLAEATQALRQHEHRLETSSTLWEIRKEEIEITGPELGVGGWAIVAVAKFRGSQVAVKRIHNQIISHHTTQMFQREMNIAAGLRHPNLVQVIGATMEGEMMIVMELMAISLRRQLEIGGSFQPVTVTAIGLDVARALNYLHLILPDPIVHRDISSANILLEELPHGKWRAKVTDYGSVNVVRQLSTENPGSPAYSAPEASNPSLQSPKMDIYSFGALILEMLTGQLPAPDDRPGLLCQVHHEQLLQLIRSCLKDSPQDRPSATDIISKLSS